MTKVFVTACIFFTSEIEIMQILLPGPQRQFHVKDSDTVSLIPGKSAHGVRVGDKLVGFSGEDVATVSLQLKQGNLHVNLQSESGAHLGEYKIPSTQVLKAHMEALKEAWVAFSRNEADELAKLLRLSMSANPSMQDMVILLDEISHTVPVVEQTGVVDAGDIYPDLANQVKKLLRAMPEEIQRFVLLNNIDHFGPDLWKAFHLLSKVDADKHPMLTRFLGGHSDFNYVVQAELAEVAANTPLTRIKGIPRLDEKAFATLVKQLQSMTVSGDYRTIEFAPAVARFAINSFNTIIPDFTAAPSFEELERAFMVRLKATHPMQGQAEDPLSERLITSLDATKYKELADFLAGKPGAKFSAEARAQLDHFVKNLPSQPAENTLSSLNPSAYERVLRHIRNQNLDITRLIETQTAPTLSKTPEDPGFLHEISRDFSRLSRVERLAFFVLDHLDPIRDRGLSNYFEGKHNLSRIPAPMLRELEAFLERPNIPKVYTGIRHFSEARFNELTKLLEASPNLRVPKDYLPTNPSLRKALYELTGETQGEPPPEEISILPKDEAKRQSQELLLRLRKVSTSERDRVLTSFLKNNLGQFRRVALLDQIWKAEKVSDLMLNNRMDFKTGTKQLSTTLEHVMNLLEGRDTDPEWDLWQQERKVNRKDTVNATPKEKLLHSRPGPERYFELDRQLPQRDMNLQQKLEDLSWVRRLERLQQRLDSQRFAEPNKFLNLLGRNRHHLRELAETVLGRSEHDWGKLEKTPFLRRKQEAFQAARELLRQGKMPNLDELFEGPFLKSEFSDQAERIQQAEMRRLEPHFRDALKGAMRDPGEMLRQIMDMLQWGDMGREEVGSRLQGMLESLREFNQHQNLNQDPLYLSLPLRLNDQQSDMELAYFRLPNKDKQEGRFLVVIHLDFENFGHLRVDALKEKDQLSATFWVETIRMHNYLLKDLHSLEDRLEEIGLGEVTLTLKQEPRRAASSVADLILPGHDGELDVRI
jgi:hypothetical protein